MATIHEATKSAKDAANKTGENYVVYRVRNNQWMYGRASWFREQKREPRDLAHTIAPDKEK